MPFGVSPGPVEGVPPGVEIHPMPPENMLPGNMPPSGPPAQGPTTPPPNIPPPISPPRPLPPASGPDLSSAMNRQRPDLQPHNERTFGPAVQAATSRPTAMDELVANQPPPSASAPVVARIAVPTVVAPVAVPAKQPTETNTLSIYSQPMNSAFAPAASRPAMPANATENTPANAAGSTSQIRVVAEDAAPGRFARYETERIAVGHRIDDQSFHGAIGNIKPNQRRRASFVARIDDSTFSTDGSQ